MAYSATFCKWEVMGYSVARLVPRREPTNPHEGYASLGMRALGFELPPKKFADVRVAIAGERIEDVR